jgi:hypothetical protein
MQMTHFSFKGFPERSQALAESQFEKSERTILAHPIGDIVGGTTTLGPDHVKEKQEIE